MFISLSEMSEEESPHSTRHETIQTVGVTGLELCGEHWSQLLGRREVRNEEEKLVLGDIREREREGGREGGVTAG